MKRIEKLLMLCKRIAALFLVFCIAYLFTAYLDGDIGVVIWSFLIIAPLISEILVRIARKRITAALETPAYVAKGKRFTVRTILRGSGRLPIPFVRCQVQQTANLSPEDARPFQSAIVPGEPLEVNSSMTAVHAGCGIVQLSSISVSDYLGDCRFPITALPQPLKVGVIPEIPSLTGAGLMLRSVMDLVQTQDEEEEETSAVYSSVSMPGYVHRDYVPGDNLRRINWKLSAKRNKLMVRMDEAAATVRPALLLDFPADGTEAVWCMRETLMEGALGFLLLLVQQGIACSLRFASDGGWKCLPLENEESVRQAAVELATADFRHDGQRLDPGTSQEKAGAYLIYTASPDAELAQAMQPLRNQGQVCCVIPRGLPVPERADAVWELSEDFQMTAVQK